MVEERTNSNSEVSRSVSLISRVHTLRSPRAMVAGFYASEVTGQYILSAFYIIYY